MKIGSIITIYIIFVYQNYFFTIVYIPNFNELNLRFIILKIIF